MCIRDRHRYDEVPRNILFSRRVREYSTSAEENIAQMQFEYLKKKADELSLIHILRQACWRIWNKPIGKTQEAVCRR